MQSLLSESATLRRLNLADTPHWRGWVRGKLPYSAAGGGNFYSTDQVEALASKLGEFARTAAEPSEPPAPPTMATSAPTAIRESGKLHDRRGPSAV